MKKLTGLKASEVSLVNQGANRRRFMVYKSAMGNEDLQKAIQAVDPKTMESVGKLLDKHIKKEESSNAARTALQAVARIMSSIKGKVSPAVAHETLDEVGFKMGEGEMGGAGANTVGESPSHGETVDMAKEIPKEDMEKAAEMAKKAWKDQLEKLGYKKYPDAEMTTKAKKTEKEDDDEEEEEEVGKSAELNSKMETIFKSNEELVKKNAELRGEIEALQLVNKQREVVQKAALFTDIGLPQEMVIKTLSDADKAGKDVYETIVKQYEMLQERSKVAKSFGGNLYGELGSSLPGGSGGGSDTAWDRIKKSATAMVQKDAGFKGTEAEAVAKFLETPEGVRLYSEHQAGRKDGI